MMMHDYHKPVMIREAIEGLHVVRGGTYVDATFGGGGHARAILERLGDGRLIAFDQDDDATRNIPEDQRLLFVSHNFRYMKNFLKLHGHMHVDGILADLGVSSHQFDQASRGFSARYDGPLDMRMNKMAKTTAREVLNKYEFDKLAGMFRMYGELRNAAKTASAIVGFREQQALETTGQLAGLLKPMAPRGRENKYLAQVFQAIRIEVNNELEALKELLLQSNKLLKAGGRLVVISYHSLEDRLVKNFMKTGNFEGKVEKNFYGSLLSPLRPVSKLQTAGKAELNTNPRARSAKLRIAEKNPFPNDNEPI